LEEKAERPESDEKRNILEAALFVSGRAMSADELAGIAGVASIGYVKKALDLMVESSKSDGRALCILKIGDKYIMSVKDPYGKIVSTLAGQPDISKGALKILAYISKNEPIAQSSIVKAFGSTTYLYVKELTDGDFVKAYRDGRSKRLETTQKFKEYFNLTGGGAT
jgi:segregation and condensation protein B